MGNRDELNAALSLAEEKKGKYVTEKHLRDAEGMKIHRLNTLNIWHSHQGKSYKHIPD